MRLHLGRRTSGPTAAYNSRYGPRDAPTITAAQRNALYRQILDRLRNAGDLSLLVEQNDPGAARRLAREVTDDLQLVLDGLGWGETSNVGVELDLPAVQLRRTFARLRERAVEQREASSHELGDAQTPYERSLIVIETCDQVLAAVGGDAQATAG
jgi:hypothetical protein